MSCNTSYLCIEVNLLKTQYLSLTFFDTLIGDGFVSPNVQTIFLEYAPSN